MSAPRVSILIPTRNGIATLPALLNRVRSQQCPFEFELVALDSRSTDGSAELLEKFADRVLRIEPAEFDHGATRNRGIEACRGEFVALLVQDAEPADAHWLANLVQPMFDDSRVAGTYARQIPRPDASAITRHYLETWLAAQIEPRRSELRGAGEFATLSAMERFTRSVIDNVSSAIRRSVWQRIPFMPTVIAEDLQWGRDVLLAGHAIVYAAAAQVIHSHERGARYEFARTWLVHRRLGELFGVRTIPDVRSLGRAVAGSLKLHRALARDASASEQARAIALAFAWPMGQYLGGAAHARGLSFGPRRV